MPKLTYKPEGVEPQTWEFTFGRIVLGEMASIQRLTKLTWDEVKAGFWNNDVLVIHALIFTFLKRARGGMKPTDVEFFEDDYELAPTEAEIRADIAALTEGEVRESLAAADAAPDRTLNDTDRLSIALLRERLAHADDEAPVTMSRKSADPKEA